MASPRIIHLIVKDWWLKLLALIVAVVLWLFARLDREYTRELRFALDFSLLPQEYVVAESNVDSVTVEIKGKGRDLLRLRDSLPVVELPLTAMKEGEERIRIGPENINLPEGIQVRGLDPYQIYLRIEKLATRRVPVMVKSVGKPAENFAVSRIEHSNVVMIYGTQGAVSAIAQVFTDSLDVEAVSESFSRKLKIILPDSGGLFSEPKYLLVKVKVEPETTVVLNRVPVKVVGQPQWGKAYLLDQEAKLTLKGPRSFFSNFNADEVELSVSVSSMTPQSGAYRVPAELSLPPGIKVDESEPALFGVMVR